MENISDTFGCMVFNDVVMRSRLPKDTYKALKRTISQGKTLDISAVSYTHLDVYKRQQQSCNTW